MFQHWKNGFIAAQQQQQQHIQPQQSNPNNAPSDLHRTMQRMEMVGMQHGRVAEQLQATIRLQQRQFPLQTHGRQQITTSTLTTMMLEEAG